MKLIGKVHLASDMTVDEVMNEFRSAFQVPMCKYPNFRFTYLQSTGGGTRSLTLPNLSLSFTWSASQVAKLGSNRGTIYILALDKLELEVYIKSTLNPNPNPNQKQCVYTVVYTVEFVHGGV